MRTYALDNWPAPHWSPVGLAFAATAHGLSGPSRARWEATGGADIDGLPISEPFVEQPEQDRPNYLVQYFEQARMEYHPEWAGTEREIGLARPGTAVYVNRPPGGGG